MTILGVILRTRPQQRETVSEHLRQLPGVDLTADPGDGRLVLVIEDIEGSSAAATLGEIALWPHVINTSLVYEYSGPDSPAVGTEGTSYTSWRDSLKSAARAIETTRPAA